MEAILNKDFVVNTNVEAKKNKKDSTKYDLYLSFTIRKAGFTHYRTPISLGLTVPIIDWGGTRIRMKSGPRAKRINDALSEYEVKAKALLVKLNDFQCSTALTIYSHIHTSIKVGLTGKPKRGDKQQHEEILKNQTIDHATELLMDSIRRNEKKLSVSRKNLYRTVLKQFHKYFENNSPLLPDITKKHLHGFKKWYYDTTIHTSETRSTYLGVINSIFNHAVDVELIPFSPVPKGFTPMVQPKDRKERTILEKEECTKFEALTDAALTPDETIAKHVAIIQMETGMQYADIVTLTRAHYKFNKNAERWAIEKFRTKSGEKFKVYVTNKAKQSIEILQRIAGGTGTLFNLPKLRIINECYTRLCEQCNISRFTSYDLRHTFAVHYMDNGGRIEILAVMMGHKKLETTKRYAKISDSRMGKDAQRIDPITA